MDEQTWRDWLERFKRGDLGEDDLLARLRKMPFEDLGFARLDHHRGLRIGFPEVVFCQGKTIEHIRGIFRAMATEHDRLLLTRAGPEVYEALKADDPALVHYPDARIVALERKPVEPRGRVGVISAGTADAAVAEEAAVTAEHCGCAVERVYDAGVAGLHRLTAHLDLIRSAVCLVVVAGMEGALPSVVGGLAPCPVIAVPTSIGYGTHGGGLVPLFGMLNSCASNVTVVNIDNGFSGGYNAALINRAAERRG
ncbi:nickel pincer cofactor biosynthesis protein LarB [Kiritimatiella glycovorans]|uniref:AIR carboxylase n=1 Tax=Kiritimatiella glycovorans TaxID=1307763 RepID=A0A0G3EBF8_9BACT|nr:nickel pincer cofactor biosynthesis protein LarB [Kiritimatiella glycovorans]AKJ63633.1 AIR carboxylase [Kiritimatiella glycovorans]